MPFVFHSSILEFTVPGENCIITVPFYRKKTEFILHYMFYYRKWKIESSSYLYRCIHGLNGHHHNRCCICLVQEKKVSKRQNVITLLSNILQVVRYFERKCCFIYLVLRSCQIPFDRLYCELVTKVKETNTYQ